MGKNKLDTVFSDLRKKKKKAFISYLTAGYPKLSEQVRIIQTLETSGVDVLEIGIPFSDPIADGPTIQYSSHKSLENGTTLKGVLAWVKTIRSKTNLPFVFMGYLNPIMNYGLNSFARDAAAAGVSGVIIPDIVPEEAGEIEVVLKAHNLHLICMVTPTTSKDRQKMIARKTGGFLYAVSVSGVTGARTGFSAKTQSWIKSLQSLTSKPVCVGFGISQRAHISQLKNKADGFIVGSALIEILRNNSSKNRNEKIAQFVRGLSKECFYGR